ncbi:MAG: phosphoribosylaminoimidazolesuccinocarboxamide synthase [Trueperaceae bacterium]
MNDAREAHPQVVRGDLRYEGKAKRVYATDRPEVHWVAYKDDATAFNAQKRGTVAGKGVVNEAISAHLMRWLEGKTGVATHYLASPAAGEQWVVAVDIVPVEVIVRYRAAGSFAARYGVETGRTLTPTVIEWCLKSDALGDPPMNTATAVALGFASAEQLAAMADLARTVGDGLRTRFAQVGLDLIDFKLEFGIDADGRLLLADEISPDTCRLWDAGSGEPMDKDRFRRDLGGVEEAYREVHRRLLEGDRS